MQSSRGWGLLTGQMVVRFGSLSWSSSLPVATSIRSIGCSAVPPKSSLMYLQAPAAQ